MDKSFTEQFIDVFRINWKAHYDAPVPNFDEEKINIFEFNHDAYEPLRNKWDDLYIEDDKVIVDWLTQEEWDDLSGMKDEFKRWANYWLNKFYIAAKGKDVPEKINFVVKVQNRDYTQRGRFTFTLNTSKINSVVGIKSVKRIDGGKS